MLLDVAVDSWDLWDEMPLSFREHGKNIGHQLMLRALAEYETRIMHRVQSLPVSLLHLAHRDPNYACPMRMEICKSLLASDGHHPTALKVRRQPFDGEMIILDSWLPACPPPARRGFSLTDRPSGTVPDGFPCPPSVGDRP